MSSCQGQKMWARKAQSCPLCNSARVDQHHREFKHRWLTKSVQVPKVPPSERRLDLSDIRHRPQITATHTCHPSSHMAPLPSSTVIGNAPGHFHTVSQGSLRYTFPRPMPPFYALHFLVLWPPPPPCPRYCHSLLSSLVLSLCAKKVDCSYFLITWPFLYTSSLSEQSVPIVCHSNPGDPISRNTKSLPCINIRRSTLRSGRTSL